MTEADMTEAAMTEAAMTEADPAGAARPGAEKAYMTLAQPSPADARAIVVNYNAGPSLAVCVVSLESEGVGEIVVVDNASSDDSMALLAGEKTSASSLRAATNVGYGSGANLGAQGADSTFLLVCNPDLVVRQGAVRRLVEVFGEQPEVALVGPMLLETSGHVYPSGREFPGLSESIGHGFLGMVWGGNPWTRRYRRIGAEQHRSREADWVSGAFFVVRRDAFEAVGGFDEDYFMYVEDVDLCWRLRRAGWKVWYEPSAQVVHEQGRSAARHPYRMLASHHRSMWRFAVRTASPKERWVLPVVAGGLALRLLLSWLEHAVGLRNKLAARHG
jgi:N-acetylglucosaminyl-diphospho-decaprenol L-rhamnosyltransferase